MAETLTIPVAEQAKGFPVTEESILEKYAKPSEPSLVEETKPGESPAPVAVAPEVPAEEETEPDLEAAPEGHDDWAKFKPLLAEMKASNPDLQASLRQIIGRHAAFTEIYPEMAEARQVKEWFPTLEDAQAAYDANQNQVVMGETFRSDPKEFAESLKQSDPAAYGAFLRILPDLMWDSNRDAYSAWSQRQIHTSLINLNALAAQRGDTELSEALALVATRGFGLPLDSQLQSAPAKEGKDSEIERLKAKLSERDQQESQSAYQNFTSEIESAYVEAAMADIEAGVKKAFPAATEEQVQLIVGTAWGKLDARLKAQTDTVSQIQAGYRSALAGRNGPVEQKRLSDFIVRRAKATLPGVLKESIAWWTRMVMGASQAQADRDKKAEETGKDAGRGGAAAGAARTPAAKPAGGRRTEQQVWDDLASGTYTRPGA